MIVELAEIAADIGFGGVRRAPVERQRAADPLAGDVIVAIFDFGGEGDAVGFLPEVAGFDIVGFELALVIADAARDAEIVADPRCEIEAALRGQLARIIIVAALDTRRIEVALAVERAGRVNLDRGADRVGIHVGGQRLLDLDRFDRVRRNDVERHRTDIAFGCRQAHAVQRRGVEFGIEPAHRDEAAFALVVQNVDARQAAQRFGDILVGELTDRVARQDAFDAVGGFLARQRAGLVRGLSDDEDVVRPAEAEIDGDAAGCGHVDRAAHGLGADVARLERVGTGRHVAETEAAVAAGFGNAAQFDDANLGALQRARVGGVGDDADDVGSEGARRSEHGCGKAGAKKDARTATANQCHGKSPCPDGRRLPVPADRGGL